MPEDYAELCGHVYVGKDHLAGWIPVHWTEFLDIGEGPDGKDVMAFEWQGKRYTSNITNRPC